MKTFLTVISLVVFVGALSGCNSSSSFEPNSPYSDENTGSGGNNSELSLTEIEKILSASKFEYVAKEDTQGNISLFSDADIARIKGWNLVITKNPNGALSAGAAVGQFNYQAVANFNGNTTFEFQLNRGSEKTRIIVGKISVENTLDNGVSSNASISTDEDIAASFSFNFSNIDNLETKFVFNRGNLVFAPNEIGKSGNLMDSNNSLILGQISLVSSGFFQFLPAPNLNGNYSVDYQIQFFNKGVFVNASTSQISINIRSVNDPLSFNKTSFNVLKNQVLSTDLRLILTDPDGFGANFEVISTSNGSAAIENLNFLKFAPTPGFVSNPTTFAFAKIKAKSKVTNAEITADLKFTVIETNRAPILTIAVSSFTKKEDEVLNVDLQVTDQDNDPLTFSIVGAYVRNNPTGTATFTRVSGDFYRMAFKPSKDFFGETSFEVKVTDGIASASRLVTVLYTEVTDPMVVNPSIYSLKENGSLKLNLRDIVSIPDVDAMLLYKSSPTLALEVEVYRSVRMINALKLVSPPSHGIVTLAGFEVSQTIQYNPTNQFHGSDSAVLELKDGLTSEIYPINLSYTINPIAPVISSSIGTSFFLYQNSAINILWFQNAGGGIDNCTITPALPLGLIIKSSNCEISGYPTEVKASANYVINATNAAGSSKITISLGVGIAKPYLNLTNSNLVFLKNVQVAPIVFTNIGGLADRCESYNLPAGLKTSLENGTCKISGTPTTAQAKTNHSLFAFNSSGSFQANFTIQIKDPPVLVNYGKRTHMINLSAYILSGNTGGSISNCTVDPILPNGLSVYVNSNRTCDISGIPTIPQVEKRYEVTATGPDGTSKAELLLTIVPEPPRITLDGTFLVLGVNKSYTLNSPFLSGGAFENCITQPSLPSGMVINSRTCVISGTPIQSITQTNFLVIASNAGGDGRATLTLTVVDKPSISLNSLAFSTEQNVQLPEIAFVSSGGTIEYCSSMPDLPAGLLIERTSCKITGKAYIAQPKKSYQISASNAAGVSNIITIDITVNLKTIKYNLGFTRFFNSGSTVCALDGNSKLFCWGRNDRSQIGDGTTINSTVPVEIDPGVKYKNVSLGDQTGCGITEDNSLKCWGYYSYNYEKPFLMDSVSKYIEISNGSSFGCGITLSNDLKCWGSNAWSTYGDSSVTSSTTPVLVQSGKKYLKLSAANSMACAIDMQNKLFCWGKTSTGELGLPASSNNYGFHFRGSLGEAYVPTAVDTYTQYKDIKHDCALTMDNRVKCWGLNNYGEVGDGTKTPRATPVYVDANTEYSSIATDSHAFGGHVCGITNAKKLKCWGGNSSGQIGSGSSTTSDILSPTPFYDPAVNFESVITGAAYYTCGIQSDGSQLCWGRNEYLGVSNY